MSFHVIRPTTSLPPSSLSIKNKEPYQISHSDTKYKYTRRHVTSPHLSPMLMSSDNTLHKVPEDDDTPIPFLEVDNSSFIECYADSIAIVDGVEYTIGSPCDHAVALCYFDEDEQLIPIELDEDLMDEIYALAAR